MSCSGNTCTCGCCAGTSVQTPAAISNLPGLPAIGYRVGTWDSFKQSMLARLSSSDFLALSSLKTRSDDDFTIALLDASAIVLDILTFYQERLANEGYLRTATQLRSLTELSRLIGYQPVPGVSASAYLAFTLKAAPGRPTNLTTQPVTIPAGTRAQSVPPQGQTPQTFETSAAISAKPDWNALPVQSTQPWLPPGNQGVWLSGTATQLQRGDCLLILGAARDTWDEKTIYLYESNGQTLDMPREQWQLVVVQAVQVDTALKLTYVSWAAQVPHLDVIPQPSYGYTFEVAPWTTAKVFALRQRAALFGHNAPSPSLFINTALGTATASFSSLPTLVDTTASPWAWKNYQLQKSNQVDLDSSYPKLVAGSWIVLVSAGSAQLYRIAGATTLSRSDFALTGKVTRLSVDYASDDLVHDFPLLTTEVLGQSEQLPVATQPLTWPLYGASLHLQDVRPDLQGIQTVALTGSAQKLVVADRQTGISFVPDDASMSSLPLSPGDTLTISDPTGLPLNADGSVPDWFGSQAAATLRVLDARGRPGSVSAMPGQFNLADASPSDPILMEFAPVSFVSTQLAPYPHTCIQLQSTLQHCYSRQATTVNANVALATHGQTVTEITGSGAASTPNQQFTLRQSPLTYVQAPTPNGHKSTLQVRANGVLWSEVPSLYGEDPSATVFATLNQDDQTTDVRFGDGVEGATLPTGQNNLQASYRIGSGTAGNVPAASITTLIDRPLGVSGVVNPSAATGGQDAQPADGVRANAPQTVLTLGRAVSLADYQNYAAGFAGIAKALATWIPSGPGRGVFLTIAGVGGAALPPGSPTLTNLAASLRNYGNPLIPITAVSYVETLFSFSVALRVDPAYVPAAVQAAVRLALSNAFNFAARSFGQAVLLDDITAIVQGVAGVVGANVTGLTRGVSSTGGDLAGLGGSAALSSLNQWLSGQVVLPSSTADTPLQLCAALPTINGSTLPQPAEILVLAPGPVPLTVLP